MAGQPRKRAGQEKPPCQHMLYVASRDEYQRCRTTPIAGWNYCPTHHEREVVRLAVTWEQSTDREGTAAQVTLPNLGKRMADLDREERAAIGYLLTLQLDELELPAPTTESEST